MARRRTANIPTANVAHPIRVPAVVHCECSLASITRESVTMLCTFCLLACLRTNKNHFSSNQSQCDSPSSNNFSSSVRFSVGKNQRRERTQSRFQTYVMERRQATVHDPSAYSYLQISMS